MSQTTIYGYDLHGNVLKSTLPSVPPSFDALNRIATIAPQKPDRGRTCTKIGPKLKVILALYLPVAGVFEMTFALLWMSIGDLRADTLRVNLPLSPGSFKTYKEFGEAVALASKSNSKDQKLYAAGALTLSSDVACIKEETVVAIVKRLARDQSVEVRLAVLDAIYFGLAELLIIDPVLPIMKELTDDSSPEVKKRASANYKALIKRRNELGRAGHTKDSLRRRFFYGGIPPLY